MANFSTTVHLVLHGFTYVLTSSAYYLFGWDQGAFFFQRKAGTIGRQPTTPTTRQPVTTERGGKELSPGTSLSPHIVSKLPVSRKQPPCPDYKYIIQSAPVLFSPSSSSMASKRLVRVPQKRRRRGIYACTRAEIKRQDKSMNNCLNMQNVLIIGEARKGADEILLHFQSDMVVIHLSFCDIVPCSHAPYSPPRVLSVDMHNMYISMYICA